MIDAQGTAQRLHTLADLIEQGQTSETTTRALDKLLLYEADVARRQLRELETDLTAYESRYGMNTRDFYSKFQAGETDDRMDFVEWASLAQMAQNLAKRIDLITSAIPS